MFKALQQLFHGRKEETEMKAETTMEKPTKQEILDVYEKLRRGVYGYDVTPSNEAAIDYLKKAGLVAVTEEHVLDGNRGLIVRRCAKWVGGWDCTNCIEYFVGDLRTKPSVAADEVVLRNEPQCRHGFDMHFMDANKGRRCPFFRHKKLLEVFGKDGC